MDKNRLSVLAAFWIGIISLAAVAVFSQYSLWWLMGAGVGLVALVTAAVLYCRVNTDYDGFDLGAFVGFSVAAVGLALMRCGVLLVQEVGLVVVVGGLLGGVGVGLRGCRRRG